MAFAFLGGVIVGSFLNVVLARLRTEETILGRSYCRSCRRQIAWYDNIPLLSYLVLMGRCRYCKDRISPRYFLVEMGIGILFALAASTLYEPSAPIPSLIRVITACGVLAGAIVISLHDAKYYEIPMRVLWVILIFVVGMHVFYDLAVFPETLSVWDLRIYEGLVAGVISFLFFYLLSAVSQERWMGYGDAYVALVIGLLLGSGAFVALLLAFCLGSIYGIMTLLLHKKRLSSAVPLAPFLFIGMGLVVLFGDMLDTLALFDFYL